MSVSISVVIPTYNRAHCIAKAIESVLSQTWQDFELIVMDDGSTDATAKVMESYASRVQYLRQKNQGPAVARNEAVRASTGEWLAFLDSDDTWSPQKLERQLRFCQEQRLDVCFHDLVFERLDTGRRIDSWNQYLACERRWNASVSSGPIPDAGMVIVRGGDLLFTTTLMMRKSVFIDFGGYCPDLPPCEDIDLYLRLARRMPIGYLADPLATRGWASNWGTEKTYRMRVEAMRRSFEAGRSERDDRWAAMMRRAIVRELRCMGGVHRRRKQYMAAVKAYAACVWTRIGGLPHPAPVAR